MSQAIVLIKELISCPECIKNKKNKRFPITPNGLKSLNIHLKMKHGSNYKLIGQLSYIQRNS